MKKTALLGSLFAFAFASSAAMAASHGYRHSHGGDRHFHGYVQVHHGYVHTAAHHADRSHRHVGHQASQPSENDSAHSHITCDMVRSYVAQVGVEQARAMALAAGMTPSQERRAKQCLANNRV